MPKGFQVQHSRSADRCCLLIVQGNSSTPGKGHVVGGYTVLRHALKANFFSCRLATRPTCQHTGLPPLPQSKDQAGHSGKGVACCPGQLRQLLSWMSAARMGGTPIWDSALRRASSPCVAAGCAGSAGCKWHRVLGDALQVSVCLPPMFSSNGSA